MKKIFCFLVLLLIIIFIYLNSSVVGKFKSTGRVAEEWSEAHGKDAQYCAKILMDESQYKALISKYKFLKFNRKVAGWTALTVNKISPPNDPEFYLGDSGERIIALWKNGVCYLDSTL